MLPFLQGNIGYHYSIYIMINTYIIHIQNRFTRKGSNDSLHFPKGQGPSEGGPGGPFSPGGPGLPFSPSFDKPGYPLSPGGPAGPKDPFMELDRMWENIY